MQDIVLSLPGLIELWQETLGDSEICVVLIDGPADIAHPCFKGSLLKEAIPIGLRNTARQPLSTHGTHVASMIFGQHEGPVRGIAPKCRGVFIPVYREDDKGELIPCSQMDLARAISQALQEGAHLINISGGELTPTGEAQSFLANAVHQCADQNVLIIAATGNEGCECLHVPAALPSVLAVGAANADGLPLEFSNWGKPMSSQAILAPGENISGAVPNNGVTLKTGTSFATPIVTGVAALLLSLQKQGGEKPNPQAVREALLANAIPPRSDESAYSHRMLAGRLNIPGAYARLFHKVSPGSTKSVRQAVVHSHPVPSSPSDSQIVEDNHVGAQAHHTVKLQKENINMANETKTVTPQAETNPSEAAVPMHHPGVQLQVEEAQQTTPGAQAPAVTFSEPMGPGLRIPQAVVPTWQSGAPSSLRNAQPAAAHPPGHVATSEATTGCECRPSQAAPGTSLPAPGTSLADLLSGFITSKNARLLYSVAEIGYDFGTEARKDYFTQQFLAIREEVNANTDLGKQLMEYFEVKGVDEINEHNYKAFARYLVPVPPDPARLPLAYEYLRDKPADSNAVIWTLNIDATPIYAIRPINQFSIVIYRVLAQFLFDAVVHDADHVSVAGHITGSVKLYNGTVVPAVDPTLRGMFNWRTDLLVEAVLGQPPKELPKGAGKEEREEFERAKNDYNKKKEEIINFLNRVYYQLRNLGLSPQERAMNYFATNAFQVKEVYEDVLKEARETKTQAVLDTINVEQSPICRPESECYDVVLQFFNPLKRIEQARKVYRQTVDVSDIVPVSVGVMRSWYIY